MNNETFWVCMGLTGQSFFTLRFLVQWIQSERAKKSVVPTTFWYLSILGNAALLMYALHRLDPVFIVGQSFGSIVYIRNIYYIHKSKEPITEENR